MPVKSVGNESEVGKVTPVIFGSNAWEAGVLYMGSYGQDIGSAGMGHVSHQLDGEGRR